jgi:acyl-[acyl-carrier-protein]-phospholipid O-acyltransferase/long-chain-fatty-acid--[acyl-carrier-protein] ligase
VSIWRVGQNHGVTELALPRRLVLVETVPVLATGKTDYVSVQKMAVACDEA